LTRPPSPTPFSKPSATKKTTLHRLRSGDSNQSDLPGGILQRNNLHLRVCPEGEVTAPLTALPQSPATTRQKAKFILATDGRSFEAENLADGETLACAYPDFHEHFGFFLPLAGITTVKQIRENAFDIKATGRLNRLYIELLKDNPEWSTAARREDLNHFMARLIFCFFAEDTAIFHGERLFTATLSQMSARDSSDTHAVLSEIFRAMNTKLAERETAKIKTWANGFPYVNGGLFSGSVDVPRFSKIARSYLLHVGNLDWTKINPDIFGSMIQAVADDAERGALGLHYTSVPNILKVLNPLFLDPLHSAPASPKPATARRPAASANCKTSARASPASASSIPPAARAISSSSPPKSSAPSKPRSTAASARPINPAPSRSPTFAASNCATSPPRSPASPSSSPSINATFTTAVKSSPCWSSSRSKPPTGSPAATPCASTG